MKAIEEACCVVTVSKTPLDLSSGSQNKAISCSGVFLNSQSGIIVCTGIVFSDFINEPFAKNDSKPLYPVNFCKDMKVYVDYTKRTDVSENHNHRVMDRPNAIRQEAKLLMMVHCLEFQDAFHKIFKRADNWVFYTDTEVLEHSRFLSWFAFIKMPTSSTYMESVPLLNSCNLKKGFPVLACGSPFGGLCPDLFMNTISKGIVSNLAGDENTLILTDARCLPGVEGGGLFVSQEDKACLVGLIISPLCWKSDEWIGLTLVCSVHLILKNVLKAVESQKSLTKMAMEFIYNSLQAPLTNNARPVCGCERYPNVALIDAGYLWGSGVLLNQQLVLTCRHVVNDKSVLTVKANMGGRFHTVSGKVLFSSAPSSPYDIAVVKLQEPVLNLLTPQFATHFHQGEDVVVFGYGALGGSSGPSLTSGILSRVITHQSQPVMLQTTCAVQSGASGGAVVRPSTGELLGVVSSNTRDFSAKVTYPHLNFSIPVTVLEPLLRLFAQTGNAAVFKALDNAEEDVRKTWRLQNIQSKL